MKLNKKYENWSNVQDWIDFVHLWVEDSKSLVLELLKLLMILVCSDYWTPSILGEDETTIVLPVFRILELKEGILDRVMFG